MSGKTVQMSEPGQDRRVARTRESIFHALMELIAQRGYEDLTVQDILDQANVGRSTFYAHFEGKEDVLLQGLEQLQRALEGMQRVAQAQRGPAFGFSRELFDHAHSHRRLFQAMVGKHSGALVMGQFQGMLLALVKAEVHALVGKPAPAAGGMPVDAVVQFVAGGLFGLLQWWMRDPRNKLGVEEMEAAFRALASPALERVVR